MIIWPFGVEVDAPGIAGPVGEDLEDVPGRMIAPDGRVQGRAIGVGRPGLADARVGEDTVAAVKPAVRAPGEAVERLVGIVLAPAVEQDLGRSVGPVVAVAVGDEQEMRGRADPDAAETDFQAAHQIEVVGEDLTRVEPAVVVGVLEDEDAVLGLVVGHASWVGIGFGDPEPAAVVDRHRDRLDDVGLAGEKRHLESRRHGHGPGRLFGRRGRHV